MNFFELTKENLVNPIFLRNPANISQIVSNFVV